MAQTHTIPEPRVAVLKWQVIETDPLGNRWVIAGFDVEDDAREFSAFKTVMRSSAAYEVREDPQWLENRTPAERDLRRSPAVHPAHEDLEPTVVEVAE